MKKSIEMYFQPKVAKQFAEHEQNKKNYQVADIVDRVIMLVIGDTHKLLRVAELGGGAHPDRYHRLFEYLIQNKGNIDWVDVSPYMLEYAKEYIDTAEYRHRREVIKYIESDIENYLEKLKNDSLDGAIMKYTIDHIQNIENLFQLLSQKLKKGGFLIASLVSMSGKIKSISTNARFLINGEHFPDNETRTLQDGDNFTVKFFKSSGNPDDGYIEGAETTKFFHSKDTYKKLAQKYRFDIYLGDAGEYIGDGTTIKQDILVAQKS